MRRCRRDKSRSTTQSGELQILRLQVKKTCKHGSSTQIALAKTFAFVFRDLFHQNFKQERESKSFCHANPSAWWDICHADGGALQNFTFPPFFFQNGGRRSFQRRQPLVSFLSPFLCETTKKGHFCFHRARAARRSRGGLCEAQGEVAGSLANPSARTSHRKSYQNSILLSLQKPPQQRPQKRRWTNDNNLHIKTSVFP